MTLPKACIFDLDGVIVDTVPAHFIAWKTMADELNIPFTADDNEHLKGISRKDSMKRILALGNMTKTDEEIDQMTDKKNAIYVEIISKMTADDILPGVVDFIQLLKDHKIPIAIGSASKNTPTILKAVGLDSTFDAIVDGNQVTHGKPDPEVFLKGAERLQVAPEECLVLEDAISGVEAAKRGGMKCLGVGEANILGKADKVVPNLKNLDIDFLKSL